MRAGGRRTVGEEGDALVVDAAGALQVERRERRAARGDDLDGRARHLWEPQQEEEEEEEERREQRRSEAQGEALRAALRSRSGLRGAAEGGRGDGRGETGGGAEAGGRRREA